MEMRKPVDLIAIITMLLLCSIWGLQQVSIKFIATDVSPVLQGTLRSMIALLAVYAVILYRKTPLSLSKSVYKYGALAGLLFGMEFLCVNEGLRYTTASHISVFIYTAPIFAALGISYFLPEERLSSNQWLGIFICFIGVLISLIWKTQTAFNYTILKGDLLGLLAGVSWGATTVVIRCTKLSFAPATHVLFFQLLGATLLLGCYTALTQQYHFIISSTSLAHILFQGVIVSFASFLIWFSLIKKYNVSQIGIFSFFTPIFGVIFSYIILSEKISLNFVFGSFFILSGVIILSLSQKIRVC